MKFHGAVYQDSLQRRGTAKVTRLEDTGLNAISWVQFNCGWIVLAKPVLPKAPTKLYPFPGSKAAVPPCRHMVDCDACDASLLYQFPYYPRRVPVSSMCSTTTVITAAGVSM
jgi:hypothetical protein